MPSFAMITDYAAAHPGLAYGLVFLLALWEAVPVIGTIVPGSTLIVGIAALAPTGAVKLWPLMAAAILGAIVGDGFSYWLGYRYHEAILTRWPLNRYTGLVEKSQAFIHRHGGKSIFLARFSPPARGFVPLLAVCVPKTSPGLI